MNPQLQHLVIRLNPKILWLQGYGASSKVYRTRFVVVLVFEGNAKIQTAIETHSSWRCNSVGVSDSEGGYVGYIFGHTW